MGKDAKRFLIPVAFGGVLAVLTLNVEHLSVISRNPFWAGVQHAVFMLLLPGMFGAMAVKGNAHAWSLWLAAALNGAIYFGVVWVLIRVGASFQRQS